MLKKTVLLDLDYDEDSMADVDCNICLSEQGNIIEIQGSAEGKSMPAELLNTMLEYAQKGQGQILNAMQEALAK